MRSKLRSRRGSTLVMVALMLGAFMGIAAIAADIGRFYVVTGELQTAADAAALRGAATLQLATSNFDPTVDAAVLPWASTTNRADGDSVVLSGEDVDVGYWDPSAQSFSTTLAAGVRPNAVRVTTHGSPRGVFSQMIGRTAGLPLTREAIAWIANVSLSCTRPWALQYLPLVSKVNGNTDTTQTLNMTSFLNYQGTSVANRTMVYRNSEVTGTWPTDDGRWTAYNMPSNNNGNANSGQTTYQSQIASCNNVAMNSDAGNGNVQPSTGNGNCGYGTTVCWALDAIDGVNQGQNNYPGFCSFQSNDATCYSQSDGTAGVIMDIAFGNTVGNGAGGLDFKYVGETMLMCIFRSTTDVCNYMPPGRATSGYAPGTMVVVTQGLKSRTINPSLDVLSNAPSNIQRFILVK